MKKAKEDTVFISCVLLGMLVIAVGSCPQCKGPFLKQRLLPSAESIPSIGESFRAKLFVWFLFLRKLSSLVASYTPLYFILIQLEIRNGDSLVLLQKIPKYY